MKIAYVVPYVPNLIRTRSYNLITQLSSLGHEVEVFTLGSSRQDMIDVQALNDKCSDIHYHVQPVWRSLLNSVVAVPSHEPLQSVYSWNREMARNLAECVSRNEFDIVHIEHVRGSRYGVFIKSMFPTIPVVWDSVDCISYLFEQASRQSRSVFGKLVTRFELPRTHWAEARLVQTFDHVIITSKMDKNEILKSIPHAAQHAPISIISNGVDLNYFHPNPEIQRDKATIVFSGKMSYHANISMVKYLILEIMPRVWETNPKTHLLIVGKDPPSYIQKMDNNPLITVTGTVDDIRPFLWSATVSVVPLLYGAGIQNKVLEAMATGTPVITSSRALHALQVQPGRELLVANDAKEFAQNILRLINDQNLMNVIGNSGLAYVRNNHNWASIASQLTNIYQHNLKKSEVL